MCLWAVFNKFIMQYRFCFFLGYAMTRGRSKMTQSVSFQYEIICVICANMHPCSSIQ